MFSLEIYHYVLLSIVGLLFVLIVIELWSRYSLYKFYPLASQYIAPKEPLSVSVLLLCEAHHTVEDAMATLRAIARQEGVNLEVHVLSYIPHEALEMAVQHYAQEAPYPIRYTLLPQTMRNIASRKMAITIGTKSARHEAVVLTQAGTLSATSHWLYTMALHAISDRVYAGPTFLAKSVHCSGALHYLYTVFGLATLRSESLKRMATEQNLAYSKQAFMADRQVFSQDLDHEGGEAINLMHSCTDTSTKCNHVTTDVLTYNNATMPAVALTMQGLLQAMEQKRFTPSRLISWLNRLQVSVVVLIVAYIVIRLINSDLYIDTKYLVYDVLVASLWLIQVLLHSIAYARLLGRLDLGGSALGAYWYALTFPLSQYYYRRVFTAKYRGISRA